PFSSSAKIKNLEVSELFISSATLKWTTPIIYNGPIDYYCQFQIKYSTDLPGILDSGEDKIIGVMTADNQIHTETITDLCLGVTYYFQIRSDYMFWGNPYTWTRWSNVASIKTFSIAEDSSGDISIKFKTASIDGNTTDINIIEKSVSDSDVDPAVSSAENAGLGLCSKIYEILPENAIFDPQADLTLFYSTAAVYGYDIQDESVLDIYAYLSEENMWKPVEINSRNTDENWIKVNISSSSLCAVLAPVPDTQPPVTVKKIIGEYYQDLEKYYVSSRSSFTLVAEDTGVLGDGSGINYTEFKIDNNQWKTHSGTVTISSEFSQDYLEGEHRIKYYSTDNAGNEEEIKENIVFMDIRPPLTELRMEGFKQVVSGDLTYVSKDTVFYIEPKDREENDFYTTASGVTTTYYSLDENVWEELVSSEAALEVSKYEPKTQFDEGHHSIRYYSVDNVNNMEYITQFNLFCDRTAPVINIVSPAVNEKYFAGQGNISVNYSITDDSGLEIEFNSYLKHSDGSVFTAEIPIRAGRLLIQKKLIPLPAMISIRAMDFR
ncbi:OmpL47-type beta-barrel domain-containing protein, partial [Elusimicrobiota bacterium]